MEIYIARQPIFTACKELYAYELLFRSGTAGNAFPGIDGDRATSSLLSTTFFTMGLERITGGKLAFINFTEKLLKNGTPHLFPKENLMVEVLEDVEPTEAVVSACIKLKEEGYQLALDDFVYAKKFDQLIELCDIIKIDFRLTPLDKITEMISFLKEKHCKLLAEKVETYEEYQQAIACGFELFQGFFFSRPEVLSDRDLTSSQITLLQLLSKLAGDDFDIEEMQKLVEHDVSISYKLINYLNSSFFGRVQPLSSIRQAISFLGERGFRQFVCLIAVVNVAEEKPSELMRLSIVRAKFLELVAEAEKRNSSEFFLLGLFSLIDAMLDKDITTIVEQLPLRQDITMALRDKQGPMFPYLRIIQAHETGNWVAMGYALRNTGLESDAINDFYLEAIEWAESFEQGIA